MDDRGVNGRPLREPPPPSGPTGETDLIVLLASLTLMMEASIKATNRHVAYAEKMVRAFNYLTFTILILTISVIILIVRSFS